MPSPMPISKLADEEESAAERRSSLEKLEQAKIVGSRLSGRDDVSTPVATPAKLCPKCGQPMPAEQKARGPDGKYVHIKCLSSK